MTDDSRRPSTEDDPLAIAARTNWRDIKLCALVGMPGVLGIHGRVWWLGRLLGAESSPWSWRRKLLGAAVVSFGAFFGFAWWARRRGRARRDS